MPTFTVPQSGPETVELHYTDQGWAPGARS